MIKSAYIHIPFCSHICSYCDFSKMILNHEWVDKYLESLKREIELNYKGEVLDTIYIGGGTPSSLNYEELNKLFDILKVIKKSKNIEYTFECNIENIDYNKLLILYKNGINRISVGVQTFNEKLLKKLNRYHSKEMYEEKISLMRSVGFKNINADLIYAIPGETLKNLENDLDILISSNIEHISTYSLIIEPNTSLYINNELNIDEDLDFEMYKLINKKLKENNFVHYEISNFSKNGMRSRHNLTYWENLEYYGFGLGASGYVNSIRYDNTRSLNKYLKGNYVKDSHKVLKAEKLENEFILGFRKIKGINKEVFYSKYKINLTDIEVIRKLLKNNKLLQNKKYIYINPKYIYTSNNILINFIK